MWARWVLVGIALACAGCELHLAVDAAFDRDGGGRLEIALAADEELRERARAGGADPLGELTAVGQELGGGWEVADTTGEDGMRTVALSSTFDGPDEWERVTGELSRALSAPEVDLLGPLTVDVDADRILVEGSAGLRPSDAVGELGLQPGEAVALLRDEVDVSYTVRVSLPGEVLGTTADERDGPVLTWTVEPGEEAVIRAVGDRPDAPVWPLAAGGVIGLLGASLLLQCVARRRRR